MPAAVIRPEQILSELRELWVNLGQEKHQTGGVLRACAMTLVVAAENDADALSASETLGELMPVHPSRAIVLKLDDANPEALSSRVFAQCWMRFGQREQICCEQVEITAGAGRIDAIPGVVLAITAPDLPVVLWCRGPKWAALAAHAGLLSLADKLILDSARSPRAVDALETLETFHARQRVADLNWTRLTGWRETVARIFASGESTVPAEAVEQIRLEHRGAAPGTGAWYLGAWLENAFPRARLTWTPSGGARNAITFSGDGIAIEIASQDGVTAEIRANGRVSHTVFSPDSDAVLLREELSILGRDAVYDAALPRALRLARSAAR